MEDRSRLEAGSAFLRGKRIAMRKVLGAGIMLAAAAYVFTYALHLLNRSSDAAVAAGYLILLGILAGAV
jgi:hypothetical protein